MATHEPDAFMARINYRVPNMGYAADVMIEGPYRFNIGVLAAKSATFFASAILMVNGSAVAITTAAGTILNGGLEPARYGRGLVFVASAANARVATIVAYDYLGSKLVETVTMNGTTPVPTKSAYKRLESISWASDTDTTTVNVGQSDVLGLPYRSNGLNFGAILTGGAPTGAGTLVAGLALATTPTATTADVRGTWTPHASDIPNGTRNLALLYEPDRTNLHGVAPFSG